MRVWLDDQRPAPPGWRWTTTVDETVDLLEAGKVTEVSLDHDLDYTDPGRDGMEVMDWIHRATAAGRQMPVVHFHTANPVGGARFANSWRDLERRNGLWWANTASLRERLKAI